MNKLGTPRVVGLVVALLAVAACVTVSSCGQTPTNVPIRTFEGAQKVAVVCLQVSDPANGTPVPVTPVPQSLCTPVASGLVGAALNYHLIATVTQTTRGELAVVDLTAGEVVDEDKSTPGINFIPVGTNPTDVVVPPNNPAFTYVSSASSTKAAIFAIPSNRILGEAPNIGVLQTTPPLLLTDLAACSLPQPPLALAILSTPTAPPLDGGAADGSTSALDGGGVDGGGAIDGGTDGGAPATGAYEIVALLGSQGSASARIVTIDHAPLDTGVHGALPACSILGSTNLSLASVNLPATVFPGSAWPDGVPYLDGGVGDLSAHEPPTNPPTVCPNDASAPADAGSGEAGAVGPGSIEAGAGIDAGDAGIDAADNSDAEVSDAGAADDGNAVTASDAGVDAGISALPMASASDGGFPLTVEPGTAPRPASMVLRDDAPLLYVGDSALPMIHVIDLSHPSAPVERAPLLATSVTQPTRQVQVGALALSPPTRDYKRYLYAIDTSAGSLMVFDVTDASDDPSSQHVPLLRPHAELNPFVPPDRVTFSAPVAAIAFAQHDWPLVLPPAANASTSIAYSGLLCNPNPHAHPTSTSFVDLGAYYRVDQVAAIQANATAQNIPSRLRGIFAFATLTNGTVVTIDVDDWDAPCRRPDPMGAGTMTGSLDVSEPAPTDTGDLDPYHVPLAYQGTGGLSESPPVTVEAFYPVSAPHRVRSSVLLRNDPTSGNHLPQVVQPPQLTDVNGTPVATSGKAGVAQPLILPTALESGFIDPTIFANPTEPDPTARTLIPGAADAGTVPAPPSSPPAGVRLAFDDPTVQQSQDWAVTYEGALPSSSGIVANIESTTPETASGSYSTLTFSTQGADLCGLGVEDWALGQERANAALCAMAPALVSKTEQTLPQWTADYVEITDDILAQSDPYWAISNSACWPTAAPNIADGDPNAANQRYDLCQATFGAPGSNPDLNINRDAPILEAYKDHLKVGRFAHLTSQIETTQNRTVDPGGPNNPPFLELMTCCFHRQAAFKVRAGGEWVAVGQQSLGLLHHVVPAQPTDPNDPNGGRCVLSSDPQARLLNARSFDVPWGTAATCSPTAIKPPIDRNSVLAMRNPLFSYVTWGGCGAPPAGTGDHTLTARDLTWKFSITGGFSPLTVSLAGTSGESVSPQSMLFVNSLGQLAIVDGADQGLVLIDLNSVAFSTNYF